MKTIYSTSNSFYLLTQVVFLYCCFLFPSLLLNAWPFWRAFSNGSVFGDRFRHCSVDDSRIWSKTAPFSFENGLVWTGPQTRKIKCYQEPCRSWPQMLRILFSLYCVKYIFIWFYQNVGFERNIKYNKKRNYVSYGMR